MAGKGRPKTGGRVKGSPDKRRLNVEEIASRFDKDPLEILLMVACCDWKGLGYDAAQKISYSSAGIEFVEDNIKLETRVQAAKEVAKYLYAQKQSVAVSSGEGGLKIIVEEYVKKTDGT